MRDEAEIAYMAAALDGEGSLQIVRHRKGRQYEPISCISQTNLAWLEQFQQVWGGAIYQDVDKRKASALRWVWTIRGPSMVKLLKAVLPYLRLKSEQAKLLLELQHRINRVSGKGRGSLSREELAIRHSLCKKCRLLNRTGPRDDQLEFQFKVIDQLSLPLKEQ